MSSIANLFKNILISLSISTCMANYAFAASTMFDSYAEAGLQAFNKQKYVEAEKLYKQAIAEIDTKPDSLILAQALGMLGVILNKEGKDTEAEPILKRAIAIGEKYKAKPDYMSGLIDHLGFVYGAQGKQVEAEALHLKALAIREKVHGKGSLETRSNLNNLACVYLRNGRYQDADTLFERSRALYRKEPGVRNVNLVNVLANSAYTKTALGQYDAAEKLFKEALDAAKAGGVEETYDASYIYANLGDVYRLRDRYSEAEALYRKSLALTEKAFGKDNTKSAVDLRNLGRCMQDQGNNQAAREYLEAAYRIAKKEYGEDNPEVTKTLGDLGSVLACLGDTKQGEEYVNQALAASQKKWGVDSPLNAGYIRNLAEVYYNQGRRDDAMKAYQKSLDLVASAIGKDNDYYRTWLRRGEKYGFATKDQKDDTAMLASKGPDLGFLKNDSQVQRFLAEAESNANNNAIAGSKPVSASSPVADKWALVIGISQFKNPGINLKYAAKDAKDFRQYLVGEAGFAPDHVALLTDQAATRENILALIGDKWLPRVAGPDDVVIIYISSHGSASAMDIGGLNYVVAHNTDVDSLYATGIPLQALTQMIKDRVHAKRVVLLLDACHSGAAEVAAKGLVRQANYDIDKVAQGTGQMIICSSSPNQVSWESKGYDNGVFTRNLIAGLRKNGKDTTMREAFQYMKDGVQTEVMRDRGQMQTPVLKSAWQGEDLRIGQSPDKPKPGIKLDIGIPAPAPSKTTASKK